MDTRRLMLFSVLCFSLYMLWDAWQKYQNPPPPPVQASTVVEQGVPTSSGNLRAGVTELGQIGETAPAPEKEEKIAITTDLFKAQISTLGGSLVWTELSSFNSHSDKEKYLELMGDRHRYAARSGLIGDNLPNHKTLLTPVPGPRELAEGQDVLQVRLEAPVVNGIKATKVYTFHRGSYVIDVTWEIENLSENPLSAEAYFEFQRDQVAPEGDSFMVSTFTGPAVYTQAEKYQKVTFANIADGKAKFAKQANDGWLAMVQHYFVSAWVPQGDTPREFYMRKLDENSSNPLYSAGVIVPIKLLEPGERTTLTVPLYSGPQEQAALKKMAPGLELVVDYGFLTIIAAPIFWALQWIYGIVGNWGWAIVVLTILIKAIFYPLSAASYRSMAKMRQVTPRLAQLKERFGDDKQRLNQEMMKLYQTEKINPLGGCLPIVVQIPVFIALYWVLLGAVEMRGAPWIGWITDLSSPDPYYVLPVIMMASMLIQTRLNPTPPDPIQAKVMMAMPLVFGVMFFFFPAGLVLYWVVNNILSIAQQWQITRAMEAKDKKSKVAANDAKV